MSWRTIWQKTFCSRTRRAMSWAYCEPKSKTSTRSSEIRVVSAAAAAESRFIRSVLRRPAWIRDAAGGNKKTPAKGRFGKGPIIRGETGCLAVVGQTFLSAGVNEL